MKFNKEFLIDLAYNNDVEIIYDKIVDHSRWSVMHEQVFKFEDKFYKTGYSVGATESQDESPYEYDDDEIELDEVFPKEVTVTIYE